ncbi:MAG: hypothetical protein IKV87_09180 [Methanobrevibacter sp.]|nr:hypothetical protein [Methanobrevibacter sp.]
MTYKECRDILFDCSEIEQFTREWCDKTIIESGANNGKGIPERTWKALFNNNLLQDNGNNTFSFIELKTSKKKSGERQIHGFEFEAFIKDKYNITPCPEGHYTYKWDGMLNGYPVSIKTKQNGCDVEMASFTRNASNTDSFYLIVGFWEGTKNNIVTIETLFIDGVEWHELFDESIVQECQQFLSEITNDVSDDEKWKVGCKELQNKWENATLNLVRPRFKRDHKSQKRMQCAINYSDFYNYFIPRYRKEI